MSALKGVRIKGYFLYFQKRERQTFYDLMKHTCWLCEQKTTNLKTWINIIYLHKILIWNKKEFVKHMNKTFIRYCYFQAIFIYRNEQKSKFVVEGQKETFLNCNLDSWKLFVAIGAMNIKCMRTLNQTYKPCSEVNVHNFYYLWVSRAELDSNSRLDSQPQFHKWHLQYMLARAKMNKIRFV